MINLVRMTEEQYKKFFEKTVREYAEENVKEGRWTESESIKRAIKQQMIVCLKVFKRMVIICVHRIMT